VPQAWLLGQQAPNPTHVSPLGQQTEPPIPLQTWLLEQQPLAVQVWPVPQAAHAAPPVPQVELLDVWQSPLLSQQPLRQLVASHTHLPATQRWPGAHGDPVPQVHWPLVQVSPAGAQVMQAPPLVPQADASLVPATQVLLLLQQPPLQGSLGPQAELQTRLLQASSVGQSVAEMQPQTWVLKHTWPRLLVVQLAQATRPVPQAVLLVPATQVVPLQQPLGQLVALQTQAPFTQAWPAAQAEPVVPQTQLPLLQVSALLPQATQARPLLPHADTVLPATQVPLEQQPPLQGLVALHAALQTPLLHASSAGQLVSELQPQTPVDRQTWPRPFVVQLTQAAPPVPQVVVLDV
jgi:hypothetical protein